MNVMMLMIQLNINMMLLMMIYAVVIMFDSQANIYHPTNKFYCNALQIWLQNQSSPFVSFGNLERHNSLLYKMFEYEWPQLYFVKKRINPNMMIFGLHFAQQCSAVGSAQQSWFDTDVWRCKNWLGLFCDHDMTRAGHWHVYVACNGVKIIRHRYDLPSWHFYLNS